MDFGTHELQELRRLVGSPRPAPAFNFTECLLGSLGSEPLEDYDLDWESLV